uniref:clavesin-1 n=1 Tax=Panthera onca TaxID=9690 RepID=UPI002955BA09|nr:clavesin-1 [Panthera onca]
MRKRENCELSDIFQVTDEQQVSCVDYLTTPPRLSPQLLGCHGCGVSALRCVDSSHLQSLRTPSLPHPTFHAFAVHPPPPGARSACAPLHHQHPHLSTITVMISTITSAVTTVHTTVSCHLDKARGPQGTSLSLLQIEYPQGYSPSLKVFHLFLARGLAQRAALAAEKARWHKWTQWLSQHPSLGAQESSSGNSFTDILRAILLSLEVLIEDPELQINGFILIIDWSNFSFKQASKLTPSILKLAIEGLQDSFPARFGGVHFVNQPWYIHALYTLIKPFLKDKTRKRIFLHGNNLNSLHQLIHPEFLPSEFGGTLPPYDMGTWARTLLGPDYSDENDYTHTSYNAMHVKHTSSNLERECSPKPMKRSQSVVEAGTLKHEEKGENENTQPLLALD